MFYFQIKGERGLPGGPGSVVLFCLFPLCFVFVNKFLPVMSVVHINTFCSTFACAKHLRIYPCIWCLIYEESVYKLTD